MPIANFSVVSKLQTYPAVRASRPPARLLAVLTILAAWSVLIVNLHTDKYQAGGNALKYEVSAEIFHHLLTGKDTTSLNEHILSHYGITQNVLTDGYGSAITDARPLYFAYLAVLKLAGPDLAVWNLVSGLALILASLYLLAQAANVPSKDLFVLAGALLTPPYFITQAFIFEPHILQAFLISLAVFFQSRLRFGWAFFAATLAILAHGSSLVFVGCLGLHLLATRFLQPRALLAALAGSLAAWGLMELFMQLLFSLDTNALLPHRTLFEEIFLRPGRITNDFAKGNGLLTFWLTPLILCPLGVFGMLRPRTGLQFASCLLPILVFAAATRGVMPGAFRTLMPFFFLGQAYFLAWVFGPCPPWSRVAIGLVTAVVFGINVHYLVFVANCLSLKESGPVAVAADPVWGPEASRLRWNLMRFTQVRPDAPVVYGLEEITRFELPNVPDADMVQANYLMRAIASLFSPETAARLGSPHAKPPIFTLTRRVNAQ